MTVSTRTQRKPGATPSRRRSFVFGGLAALATIVAVLLVAGLSADAEPVLPQDAIPVPAVFEDPGRFEGREITVTGQVDILTDEAMTLGDEDLIVVGDGRATTNFNFADYDVGEVVYATGRLRRLNSAEVEELLPLSILPSGFQRFDRRPVLLADAVVPAR